MQFISAACGSGGSSHSSGGGASGGASGGSTTASALSVEQLLIETVPILESYGNACTPHNPDSSRFGKFVVLHFRAHGALAGVAVRTYLLETTRAVRLGAGERGFHVFHELIAGARAQQEKRSRVLTPRTVQRAFLNKALAEDEEEGSAGGATAGDEVRGHHSRAYAPQCDTGCVLRAARCRSSS